MTPERLEQLREDVARYRKAGGGAGLLPYEAMELLDEVDRLNAELIEARLTAEEAWDAHDEKEHHDRAA